MSRECIECGKQYINPGRRCNACRGRAWKENNREKYLEQRRAYNKKYWEKNKPIVPRKHCEECSLIFTPNSRTPNQPYCSAKCRTKAYRKRNKDKIRIQAAIERQKYKERYKKTDAQYKDEKRYSGNRLPVLIRDNYTCQICGTDIDLVVHHIDFSGQTDSPNNDMSNLITWCRPCHIKNHAHLVYQTIAKSDGR